ncbi:hypothetical protein [uncultured Eudoraea sp.]|uniref:hypothetical protein n=1 Tax=uncultured Eudoraea sp. TaxID=1035614 RepID=UPI0026114429|nr:hypothetical protein [uncultured Eudoraea sp.]
MKKVLSIFAIVVFSIGLFSCEADNSAEDQAIYEVGTGGDDIPDGGNRGDSTGGDDTPDGGGREG